ncbi:hypothetical protein V8E51_002420 [Hyaloscypha variabilis]
MLFATLFNPPKKGKVLRKRTHNFTSADVAAHHSNTPLPDGPTARLPPPDLASAPRLPPPQITITPGPETDNEIPRFFPPPPPTPQDPARPKAVRTTSGTSLKKRNSAMPPPHGPAPPQAQRKSGEGEGEGGIGTKPKRRKSLIKNILEKRRERVEAGNNYYNVYPGREEAEREYDPSLGVDNLPRPQYSGLLIGSSELRGAGAGVGASKEEIGVAVSGEEKKRRESSVVRNFREERRGELVDVLAGDRLGKGKGRESVGVGVGVGVGGQMGGYWGDFPRQEYGGSYGVMPAVGYGGDAAPGDEIGHG